MSEASPSVLPSPGDLLDERERAKLHWRCRRGLLENDLYIENFFAKSKEAERIHATSVLTHSLSFDGVAGARAKDPNAEYLRLVASGLASTPIKISGLTLEGGYFDGTIPLPQSAAKQDIWLAPGDRVVVSTGVSPVGGNFRVDACSSYLSGASRLVPALRKSAYSGTMTYKECAARHGEESGFYTNEWRIFLGQTVELWGDSSDIIKLVDAKGKVVDALTY